MSFYVYYKLCKTCFSYGRELNHQCRTCINRYIKNPYKHTDCIKGCDYYYDANSKGYICLPDNNCQPSHPHLVYGTNECVQLCEKDYQLNSSNAQCECYFPYVINNINNKCVTYQQFIEDINDRINNNLEDNVLDLLQHYPQLNQNNSTFNLYENTEEGRLEELKANLSTIEFDDCERILRQAYKIPDSESVLIAKIDYKNDIQLTNKVIYYAFMSNGIKLDVSICGSVSINITTSILDIDNKFFNVIKEYSNSSVIVFNESDPFINDICTLDNISNKDMAINDRR